MTSMYDQVLLLPIFQGISYEQLTAILEKVHFHFTKHKSGSEIVAVGQDCSEVMFLVSGEVETHTPLYGDRIIIHQRYSAPQTLPFYYLFGTDTHHHSSMTAIDDAGLMSLDKNDFLLALQSNSILMINVMNILSSYAQKQHRAMDYFALADDVSRIGSWLLSFTMRSACRICVEASAQDWCQLLQIDQLSFWKAIAQLEKAHCIEMQNDKLKLVDRYALKSFITEKMVRK